MKYFDRLREDVRVEDEGGVIEAEHRLMEENLQKVRFGIGL